MAGRVVFRALIGEKEKPCGHLHKTPMAASKCGRKIARKQGKIVVQVEGFRLLK